MSSLTTNYGYQNFTHEQVFVGTFFDKSIFFTTVDAARLQAIEIRKNALFEKEAAVQKEAAQKEAAQKEAAQCVERIFSNAVQQPRFSSPVVFLQVLPTTPSPVQQLSPAPQQSTPSPQQLSPLPQQSTPSPSPVQQSTSPPGSTSPLTQQVANPTPCLKGTPEDSLMPREKASHLFKIWNSICHPLHKAYQTEMQMQGLNPKSYVPIFTESMNQKLWTDRISLFKKVSPSKKNFVSQDAYVLVTAAENPHNLTEEQRNFPKKSPIKFSYQKKK